MPVILHPSDFEDTWDTEEIHRRDLKECARHSRNMKANINKTVTPLRPDDVVDAKIQRIPQEVIEAFNELIAENWDGRQAVIKQDQALDRILDKLQWDADMRQNVFDKHYLDVDDIYKKAGWLVDFDRPGFNETYEGFFTFTKNTRGF